MHVFASTCPGSPQIPNSPYAPPYESPYDSPYDSGGFGGYESPMASQYSPPCSPIHPGINSPQATTRADSEGPETRRHSGSAESTGDRNSPSARNKKKHSTSTTHHNANRKRKSPPSMPSKRSENVADDDLDGAPKPSGSPQSKKRQPIRRLGRNRVVCVQCYRSKTKCDGIRPCARCIRMGKQSQCVDRPYLRGNKGRLLTHDARGSFRGHESKRQRIETPKALEVTQSEISSSSYVVPSHSLSIEKDMDQVTLYQKLCKEVHKEMMSSTDIDLQKYDVSKLSSGMVFERAILIQRLRRYADGDQLQQMGIHNVDHNKSLPRDFKLSYKLHQEDIERPIRTDSPVASIQISMAGSVMQSDIKYTLSYNKAAEKLFGFTETEAFQIFCTDSVPFLWRLLNTGDWKEHIRYHREALLGIRNDSTTVVHIIAKDSKVVPCVATYRATFSKEGLIRDSHSCYIPIPESAMKS